MVPAVGHRYGAEVTGQTVTVSTSTSAAGNSVVSDTQSRPSGRAVILRQTLFLAPLLALPLLVSASDAAAQTTQTFVSNLNQADSNVASSFPNDAAQLFATGSNSEGYSLRSVEVEFLRSVDSFSVTASIYTNSSGSPGTKVGSDLTNPTFVNTNSDRVYEFTTSGIDLDANTEYFFVLDLESDNTRLEYTSSDNDDKGL
ncbi:MAG: hypothetical protein F4157_01640 [Synechococcus sp. SB0675_bin_6]|nr:hypothetical protein [Synechococcus sp. SB0675_bin_6]